MSIALHKSSYATNFPFDGTESNIRIYCTYGHRWAGMISLYVDKDSGRHLDAIVDPETARTPLFARVMEIGLLIRCVCFHPSPFLIEQSGDHFADAMWCHVSFHKMKTFFFHLPLSLCLIRSSLIVLHGLFQPWLETSRWGLKKKNSRREREREKSWEKRETLCFRERKSIVLSEGSQAWPVRPSDEGSMEVKTLGW
jgi:hypothetical protein